MGLETQAYACHTRRFHLEDTGGLSLGEHLENLRIHWDLQQVKVLALGQHFDGVIQHCQVSQTQKVHFQQAQLLQRHHSVLADDGLIVPGQRYIFIHRLLGNDHAGSMGGCVAGHALQGLGHIDEPADLWVSLILVLQLLGQLQGIVQRNVKSGRHQLGHGIYFVIGYAQHPAHVPDGGTGSHGAEGDDLGHMVIAVFAADIVNHFLAAGIAEVHINIGHRHPLGV